MGLQNILEGIVASIIGALLFNLIFQNISKNKEKGFNFKFPKDPFLITLSITIFFGILSLFGFYYEWIKFGYLIVITFIFGFISSWIKQTQCPNCKKIFVRVKDNPEIINEDKRAYIHRPATTYLYSDGSFKNRKVEGNKEEMMETIRTQRDNFYCNSCSHKWQSQVYERNLDLKNRPKNNVVRTHYKNPEGFY